LFPKVLSRYGQANLEGVTQNSRRYTLY
jgi:hypothetical protein